MLIGCGESERDAKLSEGRKRLQDNAETSDADSATVKSPIGLPHVDPVDRENPFEERQFSPFIGERWIGTGISYGPYRDGQSPLSGSYPTAEQVSEDLEILSKHWQMIRIYGSDSSAETVLQAIRDNQLDMRVMLGAWISRETAYDESGEPMGIDSNAVLTNRNSVAEAIRLANRFTDLLVGISVGNETQVDWSDHRIKPEKLIQYIRQVRDATEVPVTTADDFIYWQTPASQVIAAEIDFIVTHVYAMWHAQQLEDAIEFTKHGYDQMKQAHPDRTIVLGEAGWATMAHDEGLQADRIRGEAGEAEQKQFFEAFTDWSRSEKIPTFYFEAFDENWKGGSHPDEVEKHWGLYRTDRTPKAALGMGKTNP